MLAEVLSAPDAARVGAAHRLYLLGNSWLALRSPAVSGLVGFEGWAQKQAVRSSAGGQVERHIERPAEFPSLGVEADLPEVMVVNTLIHGRPVARGKTFQRVAARFPPPTWRRRRNGSSYFVFWPKNADIIYFVLPRPPCFKPMFCS
jgi:hypothetical protein